MVKARSAERFDIVIVGGGSAGCVLASRLSEDGKRSVLLIEAGKAYSPGQEPRSLTDPGFRTAFNEANFWPNLSHRREVPGDENPHLHQPRLLGGGSMVNGMHAQRGLPRDYDTWSDLGIDGWSWDEVLPFFRKLENDHDFTGQDHGKLGPIDIKRIPEGRWSPLSVAFRDTLLAKGAKQFEDLNTYFGDGVGPVPLNTDFANRASALSYLDESARARPNLVVLSETRVTRLQFDGRRVTGVEVESDSGIRSVEAGETIVSAGAIHSPVLLLRSGIGPAEDLSAAGIDIKADRPGVGQNLSNHSMFSMSAMVAPSGRASDTKGPPCSVVYRFSSGVDGCPQTDMILNLWERLPSPHVNDPLGKRLADFMFLLNQPYSTGQVTLNPQSPDGLPEVNFNLLSDRRDMDRFVVAYRMAAELAVAPAIREKLIAAMFLKASDSMSVYLDDKASARFVARLGATLLSGPRALSRWLMLRAGPPAEAPRPQEEIEDTIRQNIIAGGHPMGTCRLGATDDKEAVVDSQCKVIGVEGLRVVDASILPRPVTAGTNLPVIMAAEKCASEMNG
ncbi:GMC family oxidoreductase N-terminal domain-containing protein [Erythrobacter westpacificensis]|uniref:GMC family oxidoreductase N-terminal domain-containing protein n=1 Tax=Erythrobacter westpacificensis TaxID=1055231 RepID=A0ABP9KTG7_9SPHN